MQIQPSHIYHLSKNLSLVTSIAHLLWHFSLLPLPPDPSLEFHPITFEIVPLFILLQHLSIACIHPSLVASITSSIVPLSIAYTMIHRSFKCPLVRSLAIFIAYLIAPSFPPYIASETNSCTIYRSFICPPCSIAPSIVP